MRVTDPLALALLAVVATTGMTGCIGDRRPPRRKTTQAAPVQAQDQAPDKEAPDQDAAGQDEAPAEAAAKEEAPTEEPESLGRGEPSLVTNYGVPAAGAPARGPDDALVTIVEFGGLTCETCQKNMQTLGALLQKHDDVRWVFRNYPTEDMVDRGAARAASAVHLRGAFWKLREAITAHEGKFTGPAFYELVQDIGLDLEQFKNDIRTPKAAEILARDKAIAEVFRGTQEPPFFFINGRFVQGTASPDKLAKIIEEERTKAKSFLLENRVEDRSELYEEMRKNWRGADLADQAAQTVRRQP